MSATTVAIQDQDVIRPSTGSTSTAWGGTAASGARLIQTIRPSVPLPQAQPDASRNTSCGWSTAATGASPRPGGCRPMRCRASTSRASCAKTTSRSRGGRKATASRRSIEAGRRAARLRRAGSGQARDAMKEKRASHIVFVVRDDASRSARALPDGRSDLGGVQPLRRLEPLRIVGRDVDDGGGGGGGAGRNQHPHARLHGQLQPAARRTAPAA